MARTDVQMRGLPLLNRWPEVMHEVSYRFNQISGDGVRQVPGCQNQVYIQYERDYIAQGLLDASVQAAQYLGYPPAPVWIEDEIVSVDSDYAWNGQTLSTRFGQVQAFGRRAITLIDDNVAVSYVDDDGDGVQETATLATVSGVTNIPADEIQVFFRTADGAASAGSEYWQIEGLTVTKTGDTAVITGPRWLFVHPTTVWAKEYKSTTDLENWTKFEGDVANADHFVLQVDVYRVYADGTSAVQLILNPQLATTTPVNVTADIANGEQGYFTLRTGSGQTDPQMQPQQVSVSYKAGLPLSNGRMDAQLERAIVSYASTLMPQKPGLCDRASAMWDQDLKQAPNASAYDAWHPPAFGISTAGMKLKSIVDARQNRLKGRMTRIA
jgi:hypothetical protein